MPFQPDLHAALLKNDGIITTAAANHAGISNERLRLLANRGELERVAHGVYVYPDELVDIMHVAQLRRPKAIYSHETALFLHGLTDRDPIAYSVTVPRGYNAARLQADGLNVFTANRELHEVGVTQATTMFGRHVTAYGLERTICDCIRSRNKMDIAVVSDALKRYVKRPDKRLDTLMHMAAMFRVTTQLRNYLEVLL